VKFTPRECVNLVTHTTFTALCVIEVDSINKFNARESGYKFNRRCKKIRWNNAK